MFETIPIQIGLPANCWRGIESTREFQKDETPFETIIGVYLMERIDELAKEFREGMIRDTLKYYEPKLIYKEIPFTNEFLEKTKNALQQNSITGLEIGDIFTYIMIAIIATGLEKQKIECFKWYVENYGN